MSVRFAAAAQQWAQLEVEVAFDHTRRCRHEIHSTTTHMPGLNCLKLLGRACAGDGGAHLREADLVQRAGEDIQRMAGRDEAVSQTLVIGPRLLVRPRLAFLEILRSTRACSLSPCHLKTRQGPARSNGSRTRHSNSWLLTEHKRQSRSLQQAAGSVPPEA